MFRFLSPWQTNADPIRTHGSHRFIPPPVVVWVDAGERGKGGKERRLIALVVAGIMCQSVAVDRIHTPTQSTPPEFSPYAPMLASCRPGVLVPAGVDLAPPVRQQQHFQHSRFT